ncbi:MAG: RNA polymerase sigma factor, partial [Pedobacter sp.]
LSNVLNFEAWVKRIAINKSISHLRKRKIEFADLGFTEAQAEEDYDIAENEIFESKVEDVKKCIAELPDGYRTIVTLYLFEQMPQEEISKLLGISHNTVRTQYHRAKKKILTSLKDKSYYE